MQQCIVFPSELRGLINWRERVIAEVDRAQNLTEYGRHGSRSLPFVNRSPDVRYEVRYFYAGTLQRPKSHSQVALALEDDR